LVIKTPPRTDAQVAAAPMRRDFLRLYVLTEARLKTLAALPHDERAAIVASELEHHRRWATAKWEWLHDELVENPLDPMALAPGRPRHTEGDE
jgi:hypothetical protein